MELQLRNYQQRAVDIVLRKFREEQQRKQVLVLATGLGKTVIFAHIIKEQIQQTGKKALVLAHREELLEQAKDKILRVEPNLRVEIEMANQKASPACDVVIASVATLGRTASTRIKKFDPKDFCLIVIDEAHHSSASTYKNVLSYFGVLKNDHELMDTEKWRELDMKDWNEQCLLLGVTATPSRNDNEGIDTIFDEVTYTYGIVEGIQDGWLSRIKAWRVDTTTSLEGVHTLAGDFKQDELADAINNPERNDLVVKTYLEHFDTKQALVFAIDVAHAMALQQAFIDKKIMAAVITGNTPKDDRRAYLEKFHTKEIPVVINCMVLTEGYDNDTIDVIMMARPTKSGILYSQMVGRGTRIHEQKPYLTIVDFVDNTYRHTIKTSASLIGVEGMVNFRGGDIVEAMDDISKLQELAPDYNLNKLDFDKLDYLMEEVDLLGGLDIPLPLNGITDHSWHRYGENAYRIGIGDHRYFIVREDMTGQWKATREDYLPAVGVSTDVLGECPTLEAIVKRVDNYIVNNFPESLYLINMQAKWRKDPPSEAQVTALRRLGVSPMIIEQLDKGKASQLQTKLYAMRGKKRA